METTEASALKPGWTDYLDADQRAWQRYLAAEREAATLPTNALRATVERG